MIEGLNIDTFLLGQSIVTLFAIFDPVGAVPIFSALTQDLSVGERRDIINKSCLVSAAILLTFALAGSILFSILGITLTDFKIVGGIILLIFSIEYVMGRSEKRYEKVKQEDISVFPLATPLLAGPGSISVVLLMDNILLKLVVIVVVVAIAWLALYLGTGVLKVMGRQGSSVVSRIMGLIIGAIAVRFIREGLAEIQRPR